MHLSNAGGESAPPFLILSCSDIPKGSFFLREVPGLNWNSVIGSKGYLAISNTRCGTEDLWLEWYKQVLLYFPRLKLRMINIKQKV